MKVLIIYASAGIGHKKAAQAVRDALTEFNEVKILLVDILDYTNRFFRFSYPRIYLFLINKIPLLWGFLYYFFEIKTVDKIFAPFRRFFHHFYAKRFIEFVLKENPDVVISTHFFSSEAVSESKKKAIFKGRLITVITDFLPHSFWLSRNSDYFIAAIERTKKELIKRGIEQTKIRVLGIPCQPKFGISRDKKELIKKLGLEPGFFNVLIMGGGFGTGPLKAAVYSICTLESRIKDNLQIIVICGNNKELFEGLKKIKTSLDVRLSIFGYMDNIEEFMGVSDCIITKSGGLTVSESLSQKLPMVIIRPIPGQETRNCKVLTDFGVAVRVDNVNRVKERIREFIDFPEEIMGMQARINLLAYPDAAKKIAEFIIRER